MRLLSAKSMLDCGTAMAGLLLSTEAFAQTGGAAGAERAAEADVEAVVVTGSRIRRDGFQSPVPLTVIDATVVEKLGQSSAQDIVRLIPQIVANQSDAVAGNRLTPDIGASYANLRGMNPQFGTRTLTLVNTRRFVPTSDGGQVDLNLIPSVMVGRVETVTGGASAAYGSDAVAGVVNIILDNQLQGFKVTTSYGQTGRGDGQTYHGAAAYGSRFAEGRGHVMLGGEFQRSDGIGSCAEVRSWCAESWGLYTNAAVIPPGTLNIAANISGYNVPGSVGYGLPNYVIGPGSGRSSNSPNGLIRNLTAAAGTSTTAFSNIFPAINPPLAAVNKVFTADGKGVIDYDPGAFAPKSGSGQVQGGTAGSVYDGPLIQTPVERFTTYAAGEYELSDSLKLSAEATYGKRKSSSVGVVATSRTTMAFKPDNAFLPASVTALLNGANFGFAKEVDNELTNRNQVEAEVLRGVVGLSGALFADWTWDAYYQYGVNKRHSSLSYSRHNDAFVMAIDAIRNPANPSQIICRPLAPATLATFTPAYQAELRELYAACVPLNMFGVGNMSQAAIDYVWRPVAEDFEYDQHAVSASVQGALFEGWGAGPIGFAAGVDHRAEAGDVTHGGINPNAFAFTFGLDYAGEIKVTEGFAETNLPVFRDFALGKYLEFSGAIRSTRNESTDTLSDQSKKISATSWKVGSIYDLVDGLRLRSTYSQDIRAAGFRELFQKTAPSDEGTLQGRVNNPNITGPNKVDNTPIYSGGNFDLSPEVAKTLTIGGVLSPTFLPGLRMSLDWYEIKLTDAIANLTGQRITDLCVTYGLNCDRVTFASPTNITRINAGQANVGRVDIRGVDIEASYRLPLADLYSKLDGALDLRALVNHQYNFVVQQNATVPELDYAGQSGPVLEAGDFNPTPEWMWNALIGYDNDNFNATLGVRHIGEGVLNREWIGPEDSGYAPTLTNSVSTNRVESRTYVTLAMSYKIPLGDEGAQNVEVFGAVDNLFDEKPPVAPGGGATLGIAAYPTNPVFFDTFGMRWKAGVRARF